MEKDTDRGERLPSRYHLTTVSRLDTTILHEEKPTGFTSQCLEEQKMQKRRCNDLVVDKVRFVGRTHKRLSLDEGFQSLGGR